MFEQHRSHVAALKLEQPEVKEVLSYFRQLSKSTVHSRLQAARRLSARGGASMVLRG